ncbi:MAG TPA: SPW repeat protein [Solirubrobacter sp.]|nr:SPW repeat protein [Solirubrobacter sp.]
MAEPSTPHRPAAAARPRRAPEAPPDPAPVDEVEREEIGVSAWLNVIAGIWLIIAPFVLGYGDGDPYWNDIIFGALIAVAAAARAIAAPRLPWLSALNMLFGAWIFASAFWLESTSQAIWNNVILGVVVFVLALLASSAPGGRAAVRRY